MGIPGIYQEIGNGRRVALSKLAADHYIAHSRPFRLAIDISIWLFQIQSGRGGTNPAPRTFYYRLLRLLAMNIHPIFVFDGKNKPGTKRNKQVGGGKHGRVAGVPEVLAKQLLKHFGFPCHYAPGEAEAECALLQREGIVDAVLSEDVDTLMFGSGTTLRVCKTDQTTHVIVHEAHKTKEISGLDREGMILVAMMSGGDYDTEGIPGCGPKLASEAARAGFGAELCKLDKKDTEGLNEWRDRLRHEIRTNESKFFRQKRPGLTIPDNFPNPKILGYYTHPAISGPNGLAKLRESLKWDLPLDYPKLREFTADTFDWRCIGGAKKFIRNLAPAILARELRMRGEAVCEQASTISQQATNEALLINGIHGKRTHSSTDNTLELRISFTPIKLIDIDLSVEPPDDEDLSDGQDSDLDPSSTQPPTGEDGECPGSPKKKRAPSNYDPTIHEKVWMLDTFVSLGAPLMVQDWEASATGPKTKTTRTRKPTNEKNSGGMVAGALDRFTKVTKPGINRQLRKKTPEVDELDLSGIDAIAKERSLPPGPHHQDRSQSTIPQMDLTQQTNNEKKRSSKRPSPEPNSPSRRIARPRVVSPFRKPPRDADVIEILSSPVKALVDRPETPPPDIRHSFRRCSGDEGRSQQHDLDIPLPDTVTRRRKKSPLRRFRTAPVSGNDIAVSPVSRPTTPRPIEIEAMDLASPGSLPSLPRPGFFQNRETSKQRDRSPSPKQMLWKEPETVNLSSSMPTPPLEDVEKDTNVVFTHQTISATVLLPVNKRLRDRTFEKNASSNVVLSIASVPAKKTEIRASPGVSRSATVALTTSAVDDTTKFKKTKVTKKFIKPRDSLPGGWKEIELEVDLTQPTPPNRRLYRKSGVEEVDLTGD